MYTREQHSKGKSLLEKGVIIDLGEQIQGQTG